MFSNPVGLEHEQPLPPLTTAVSSYYRIYYGTPKGTPPLARHSVFVSQICGLIRISIESPQKNFEKNLSNLANKKWALRIIWSHFPVLKLQPPCCKKWQKKVPVKIMVWRIEVL